MSEENVKAVRAIAEAFQRRDREGSEKAFDVIDPDVEWDASRMAEVVPDLAGVYRGHDGVRTFWRR